MNADDETAERAREVMDWIAERPLLAAVTAVAVIVWTVVFSHFHPGAWF